MAPPVAVVRPRLLQGFLAKPPDLVGVPRFALANGFCISFVAWVAFWGEKTSKPIHAWKQGDHWSMCLGLDTDFCRSKVWNDQVVPAWPEASRTPRIQEFCQRFPKTHNSSAHTHHLFEKIYIKTMSNLAISGCSRRRPWCKPLSPKTPSPRQQELAQRRSFQPKNSLRIPSVFEKTKLLKTCEP